ncbi:MAG: hypothetical protein ABSC31_14680 [Acidimicrobiales bacterium]|jgi:hypothetical protein
MSDALNEPQADGVVPSPGIDAPVQPEPAAEAMPVAAAFPDFGQGTGLDQASATVPPPTVPAPVGPPVSPSTLPPVSHSAMPPGPTGRGKQVSMSGLPPAGLSIIGLLTVLLGAWAGLSVLVGPSFGWSPDGSPSWHWSLIRAALHVAPGGAALIAGVAMVAIVPKAARGAGRSGAALAGLLAILAGAWLVVGPSEWPVLKSTQQIVFAPAAPMRSFTYVVGANLGPGFLLAVTGAFAVAWAARVAKVRGPV